MVGLGERKRVVTYGFGDGDAVGGGFLNHDGDSSDCTRVNAVDDGVDYGAGNYDTTGTGRGVGRPTCSELCRGLG